MASSKTLIDQAAAVGNAPAVVQKDFALSGLGGIYDKEKDVVYLNSGVTLSDKAHIAKHELVHSAQERADRKPLGSGPVYKLSNSEIAQLQESLASLGVNVSGNAASELIPELVASFLVGSPDKEKTREAAIKTFGSEDAAKLKAFQLENPHLNIPKHYQPALTVIDALVGILQGGTIGAKNIPGHINDKAELQRDNEKRGYYFAGKKDQLK